MKVQYELPHTKNIKKLYFRKYNNGRRFDWNNIEHISVLNRWRAQVFRYVNRTLHMRATIRKLTIHADACTEAQGMGVAVFMTRRTNG